MESAENNPDAAGQYVIHESLESLAWDLLVNDDIQNLSGDLLPFITNIDGNNTTHSHISMAYQQNADLFQVLITLYMEMIFSYLKIVHMNNNAEQSDEITNESLDKTFASSEPDMTKYSIDDLTIIFREKMKIIGYYLSTTEINIDEADDNPFGESDKYYCKIILKDTPYGKLFYGANKNTRGIDHAKRYTFALRNDSEMRQKKLEDFYAVCQMPLFKVKISFTKIKIPINK